MKHILCPVDGSEHARRAVRIAAEMAVHMKAKLSLLYVREYVVGRVGTFEVSSPEDAAKCLEDAKRIAKVFVQVKERDRVITL
jgi:nucleotide-binding universal stress UspA family protein